MYRLRSLSLAAISALLMAVVPALPAASASWDAPILLTRAPATDAVVDSNGKLHVVTGSYDTGIRYLRKASGAWQRQNVTTYVGDLDASIAVAGGKVYIAFVRLIDCDACAPRLSTGILFATNRSGSWKVKRLTSHRDVSPSIAVRNGRARIAYNDGKGIRYLVEGSSGAWTSQRVWKQDAGLGTVYSQARVSLVLDANGKAHIAFDRTSDDPGVSHGVSYITNKSGSWTTKNLHDGAASVDRIRIDSAGRPHIGYTDWLAGPAKYRILRRTGGTWTSTLVPGGGSGSFSLDGDDRYEVVRLGGTLTWYARRASGWLSKSWTMGTNLTAAFVRATDIGTTYLLHTTWSPDGEETWLRLRH